MANQKVTQLPAATTSNDTDLLYVVQAGVSKQTTKQLLMAATLAVATTANSAATAAQTTATAAQTTATAAQTTANSASTTATAAQSTANSASSAATAAQTTATQAVSDASAAQTTANAALPKAGGTMTGGLNMGSQSLSNLAAPNNTADAATKGYVDTGVSSASSAASAAQTTANAALSKAGGTMTGGLNMGSQGLTSLATPVNNTDAATKGYVDTSVSAASSAASAAQSTANTAVSDAATAQTTANAALPKAGGTMSGTLNMGAQSLTNLGTPTNNSDATTKTYVDTALAGKQNTVATTTGVSIAFVTPQEYGSYATAQTGNITVSLTNAVRGVDQTLYHDDTVAPTITVTGGTAVKFGTASYDLTKVNIILFWWMGGTSVGYVITPAV